MSKVLILFAHPRLQNSKTHTRFIEGLDSIPNIRFHDLYEAYPDFDIDVPYEQDLLLKHDIYIMQHPFYWYGSPPILKQWIDLVLEHGWAYGQKGKKLVGKKIMNVISTGGRQEAYAKGGFNRFTIREFLIPFEQTALLCNMTYLPPFVFYGTHLASEGDIANGTEMYHLLLKKLTEDAFPFEQVANVDTINDFLKANNYYGE